MVIYKQGVKTMSKQWISEAESLMNSIEKEHDILASEYKKIGTEFDAKASELAHWRAVIQSYNNRQQSQQPNLFLQNLNLSNNLSHRDVIFLVRDQNDGFIPMKQVTEAFKSKVKNPNHAASAAYSTLKRMVKQEKVVKVEPGLYRWLNGVS